MFESVPTLYVILMSFSITGLLYCAMFLHQRHVVKLIIRHAKAKGELSKFLRRHLTFLLFQLFCMSYSLNTIIGFNTRGFLTIIVLSVIVVSLLSYVRNLEFTQLHWTSSLCSLVGVGYIGYYHFNIEQTYTGLMLTIMIALLFIYSWVTTFKIPSAS